MVTFLRFSGLVLAFVVPRLGLKWISLITGYTSAVYGLWYRVLSIPMKSK